MANAKMHHLVKQKVTKFDQSKTAKLNTTQTKTGEVSENIFVKKSYFIFFRIYSLASDLLVSLNRNFFIKDYDKSDAKGLRSLAPGRYSLT